MKKFWDHLLNNVSTTVREQLINTLNQCEFKNPNDSFQCAVVKVLEKKCKNTENCLITDKDLKLLILTTYVLTPKMRADKKLISLLYKFNHPFTNVCALYYEENPSNYGEILLKVEKELNELKKRDDYTVEQEAIVLAIQSWLYGQQGDIPKLKIIHKRVNELLNSHDDIYVQFGLQDASLNIVWWYLHLGVEEDVKRLLKDLEPYIDKYRFYTTFTSFLNVKGAVESFLGNNLEALKSFQRLVEIHSQYNDEYRLSIAMGNMAEVLIVLGKIKKAKEMMEKAIKLYKTSTGKWPYLYLTELGNIYYALNDPRAEESFLHAYEIQKKERSIHKAYILFELIHFYLRKEEIDKAKSYLKELKSLAKHLEAPTINARVDYLEGFYELLRFNITNGINYLQSSLKMAQHTKDAEIIQYCQIQLSTAYLLHYKFSSKEVYLNKALNYIEAVYQLSLENNHYQALVLSGLIRTIITLLAGKIEQAEEELKKLEKEKENIDISYFLEDINNIKNALISARETGEISIALNKVIEYLLPQFRLLLSFKLELKKVKKAEVLGVLIISDAGIPVFSKLRSSLKTDDLLLSGLLMAINQVANSILSGQKGRLQEVKYKDFAITIQTIKNGMIAIIATEITANVRIWALSMAERLKELPSIVTSFVDSIPEQINDLLEQMELT